MARGKSRLSQAPRARADIVGVLAYTLDQWGAAKYWEYRDLIIEEAYEEILADPECGRIRPQSRPNVRGYHIGKPGRRARHIVFYRVGASGEIEVVRFLHDAMDPGRHL
jgi:toxin ParE1/3/4